MNSERQSIKNPFNHNYCFAENDARRLRLKITWLERFFLFFRTTYVQCADGYVFYFKQIGGKYYLLKTEKLPEITMPNVFEKKKFREINESRAKLNYKPLDGGYYD